jgi:hypothetical protein
VTIEQLVGVLRRLYPSSRWPKPFNLLAGRNQVAQGLDLGPAAKEIGTTPGRLKLFCDSTQPLSDLLGAELPDDEVFRHARQILGNLIVGRCAELTFETLYKEHTNAVELELRDLREGRSDTDYRLFNGRGRPVYRVNIKFHGTLFRRAKEMVGLEPEDCFALATYKIDGALQKQKKDELPYMFVIVSVPDLKADAVGTAIPLEFQEFVAQVMVSKRVPRKRDIEDRTVDILLHENHPVT